MAGDTIKLPILKKNRHQRAVGTRTLLWSPTKTVHGSASYDTATGVSGTPSFAVLENNASEDPRMRLAADLNPPLPPSATEDSSSDEPLQKKRKKRSKKVSNLVNIHF